MPSSSTTIPQKVDNAFKTKDLPTATRAAQEYFDRAASEDYEGAYDLTSTKFRNSMTKRGYVRMQKACVKVSGLSGDVTGTRISGNTAHVRREVAGFTFGRTLTYEKGAWWIDPDEDSAGKSAEELIAKCKEG